MKLWHSELAMKLFEGDRLEAMKVIEPYIPDRLFKYMGPGEHSFENLSDSKFYMSYPSNFNDPYDSLFSLLLDKAEDDNLDKIYTEKNFNDNSNILDYIVRENEIREMVFQWRNAIKCCSFSEVNDSILMWSHYAQNHKGVCAEYNFKHIEFRTVENELYPIRYEQNMIRMDIEEDLSNIYLGLIAAIVKSDAWKYEKEWRIVIPSERGVADSRGNTFVGSPKPVAIYLGANISRADRENYLALAREKDIDTFSVHVNPRKFRLEFIQEFSS